MNALPTQLAKVENVCKNKFNMEMDSKVKPEPNQLLYRISKSFFKMEIKDASAMGACYGVFSCACRLLLCS